jgi:hypothetical protein
MLLQKLLPENKTSKEISDKYHELLSSFEVKLLGEKDSDELSLN